MKYPKVCDVESHYDIERIEKRLKQLYEENAKLKKEIIRLKVELSDPNALIIEE